MHALSFITGVSIAWLAAGVAAAALPVVAHLLRRKRGPVVVFPGARLVREARAHSAGKRRLRDAILLAVRVAMVGLIALAFDRPSVVLGGARADTGRGAVDLVVVLDVSASMARVEGGVTLLERAQAEAGALLRSLDRVSDRGAVVFAAREARSALPTMSANFDALLAEARSDVQTLERGDMQAALVLAGSLPGAPGDGERRAERVAVVLSDLQRTAWEAIEPVEGLRVEVRSVGPDRDGSNVALSALRARREGSGLHVEVEGRSSGGAGAVRGVEVRAGASQGSGELRFLGESGSVALPLAWPAEPAALRAALDPADDFPQDDAREIEVGAWRSLRVAIVTGEGDDPRAGARFVEAALAALAEDAPGAISVRRIDPNAIAGADDAAIVLIGAGALDAGGIDGVAHFLTAGGAVVWFIDSEGAAGALGQAGFGGVRPPHRLQRAARLRSLALGQPGAGAFDGPSARALSEAELHVVAPVGPGVEARALAGLDDGAPFALAWAHAGGRLVTVHASVDLDDSTLARSPVFPALVGELVRAAVGVEAADRAYTVGEPIVLVLPAGAVARPPLRDSFGRRVTLARDRLLVEGAPAPGLLRVMDGAGGVVASATVAIDEAEGDLRALGAGEAQALVSSGGHGASRQAMRASERTVELWPALIALALALGATESLITWRWRKEGRGA